MSNLRIRDYVELTAPEPEILRIVGEEAKRNGTSKLTSCQIDRIICAAKEAGIGIFENSFAKNLSKIACQDPKWPNSMTHKGIELA